MVASATYSSALCSKKVVVKRGGYPKNNKVNVEGNRDLAKVQYSYISLRYFYDSTESAFS